MGNSKTIDWDRVDKLCKAGCPMSEIAGVLGVVKDVIYKACVAEKGMHWADYKSTLKQHGNGMIREKQYDMAIDGDRTMLIWLGKNRLKQAERSIVQNEYDDLKKMSDEELKAKLGQKNGEPK